MSSDWEKLLMAARLSGAKPRPWFSHGPAQDGSEVYVSERGRCGLAKHRMHAIDNYDLELAITVQEVMDYMYDRH
jgi:hypothetical protein